MEGKKEASVTSKWKGREESRALELSPVPGKGLGWEGSTENSRGLREASVLNAYVVGRWVLGGQ